MTLLLRTLAFDAHDPVLLARFWAAVLGREVDDDARVARCRRDEIGIRFTADRPSPRPRPNQTHFDLTSASSRTSGDGGPGARRSAAGTSTSASCPRRSTSCSPTPRATSSASSSRATTSSPAPGHRCAVLRRDAGGRLLLERGAGLAAGVGPGRGDRDPVAGRRLEDLLGWPARSVPRRAQPAAPRARARRRQRPGVRGGAARRARGDVRRRAGDVGRAVDAARPGRQRAAVLPASAEV